MHLAVNRIHRADYTMSNSVNSRLSLQLRGTKPPVESSKRNSLPSKLPGVAEGNSSPRPLSKLPVINSPSTKSGSGGGPSVAANSPAPMTRDKSTPPSSPPRGGTASPQGEIPTNFVFSAKTCLELLPKLTTEQLHFELNHFNAIGCQFEQISTKSATFPKKQLVKLISDVLSKKSNSQYQLVLEKFNNVFSSISRLTEDANEHIREMQVVRKRPSATPPVPAPADDDHDKHYPDGKLQRSGIFLC